MDFAAMFQTWRNVLTKPGEPVFEEERHKPAATLTNALIWMVIAGIVAAIFGAIRVGINNLVWGPTSLAPFIEQFDLPPEVAAQLAPLGSCGLGLQLSIACIAVLTVPIVFLISSVIHLALAKVVGGTGSFEEHTFLLATIRAPLTVVSSVINIIPFLGGCVAFALLIYQIVLTYFAMKTAHNLTTGKALFVAITPPLIALLCLCGIIVTLVGTMAAMMGGNIS
jgi:hypothetical protein